MSHSAASVAEAGCVVGRDQLGNAEARITSDTSSRLLVIDVWGRAHRLHGFSSSMRDGILRNRAIARTLTDHLAIMLRPPALVFPVRLGADRGQRLSTLVGVVYLLLVLPFALYAVDEPWQRLAVGALMGLLLVVGLWLLLVSLFHRAEVTREAVTLHRLGGRQITLGGADLADAMPWLNRFLHGQRSR